MKSSIIKTTLAFLAFGMALSSPTTTHETPERGRSLGDILNSFERRPDGRFELRDGGVLARLDGTGQVLGQIQLSAAEVATIGSRLKLNQAAAAAPGTSKPGSDVDDALLGKRDGCLYGTPCGSDQTCWFVGCTGCIFTAENHGYCYGTIF